MTANTDKTIKALVTIGYVLGIVLLIHIFSAEKKSAEDASK